MLKYCIYCNKEYPEGYYGVALTTKSKVYRRRKCRYCYRETKQILIRRYKGWIDAYKTKRGCERCNITDPRVLDFHHSNTKDKKFTVGSFRRSVGFLRIKNEIEKCQVLCANCHRILHEEEGKDKSVQKRILKIQ